MNLNSGKRGHNGKGNRIRKSGHPVIRTVTGKTENELMSTDNVTSVRQLALNLGQSGTWFHTKNMAIFMNTLFSH